MFARISRRRRPRRFLARGEGLSALDGRPLKALLLGLFSEYHARNALLLCVVQGALAGGTVPGHELVIEGVIDSLVRAVLEAALVESADALDRRHELALRNRHVAISGIVSGERRIERIGAAPS